MIDCSTENIWYKKRKKPKKRIFSFFVCLLIIFLFLFYYFKVVTRNIYEYSSNYIYSFSSQSLNSAILDSIKNTVEYEDIINIQKDNSGNIVLMSCNSLKVNSIARKVVNKVKTSLGERLETGVPIPFTTFLGLNYLSAYGKEVNFKSLSVANTECDFISNFSSVGINQTLHSIYIVVKTKVNVTLPLYNNEINCSSKILLSESIIVGKVPEVYLNGNIFPKNTSN